VPRAVISLTDLSIFGISIKGMDERSKTGRNSKLKEVKIVVKLKNAPRKHEQTAQGINDIALNPLEL